MTTVTIDAALLQGLRDDLAAVEETLSGMGGVFLHLADIDYVGAKAAWADRAAELDDVTGLLIHLTSQLLMASHHVRVFPCWRPEASTDRRRDAARQHLADRVTDLWDRDREAAARRRELAEVAP